MPPAKKAAPAAKKSAAPAKEAVQATITLKHLAAALSDSHDAKTPVLTAENARLHATRTATFEGGTMKLYYLPGSCALGPHIALEYSGLPYEAVRVERGRQTDPAYLAINPLGRVPTPVRSGRRGSFFALSGVNRPLCPPDTLYGRYDPEYGAAPEPERAAAIGDSITHKLARW